MKSDFPLSKALWPGCLLATVCHAVFICRAPYFSHQRSWDGLVYNVQDSEGGRGSIAFGESGEAFVGVFFLESSSRNPWNSDALKREYISWVGGVPDTVKKLSEKALLYVHQEVDGVGTPVITSAFWSDASGGRIHANEAWPGVVEHGAILVQNELLPLDAAVEKWIENYEFESAQIDFAKDLLNLRLKSKDRKLILDSRKLAFIRDNASDEEGVRASLETLSEIGICFET